MPGIAGLVVILTVATPTRARLGIAISSVRPFRAGQPFPVEIVPLRLVAKLRAR
jgi:hypothetical protein